MIDRHNALFLYLVFLALQFVAIVTFFPNTPIYNEQITVVSELDDGETGKKVKWAVGCNINGVNHRELGMRLSTLNGMRGIMLVVYPNLNPQ